MGSNAWWANGSQLKLGDGATPEVFTAIAEIKDLSLDPSRDSEEVTHQGSAGWKDFIPVLRDGGSVKVDLNWLPNDVTHDGTTGWWSTFNDDENHNWQIVTPAAIGITIALTGHIDSPGFELPVGGGAKASISIKCSGAVTVS